MKAVVKARPEQNGTEIVSVDIPTPGSGEVLIKVRVASICGTDVHIFNWDAWAAGRIKPPLLYGHEFAGEVVAVGQGVANVSIGDKVSGECHIACGHCLQCTTGLKHVCQDTRIFGVDAPGVFAEYACIPASNVWLNDPESPPEICSIQDPFGNAVHSVFSADVPGRDVAVIGLGPIGLMCVALCKRIGAARVFAVGRKNAYRMELGRKVGADRVLGAGDDAVTEVKRATGGKGADVVLEMSGSAAAVGQGLDMLRSGGELVALGLYSEPVQLDFSRQVIFKYATIRGINGRRMFEDWHRMRGLLKNPGIREALAAIITHRFKFGAFHEAMETMRSGQSGKVILEMPDKGVKS